MHNTHKNNSYTSFILIRFEPQFSAVLEIFFVGGRLWNVYINAVYSRSSRYNFSFTQFSTVNRGLNSKSGKRH